MNETELKKKIDEQIKKLVNEKGIHLFCSNSESYHKVNEIILKELTIKYKLKGIYITLNMSHSTLENHLINKGIDVSKLHFIDSMDRKDLKSSKADNCTFVPNPQALTELSLAITNLINTGKYDFLFLDSISTLLVYHSLKTTAQFTNYLMNKLRNFNLRAIIISLNDDEESKKLIPIISQFCDECVQLYM